MGGGDTGLGRTWRRRLGAAGLGLALLARPVAAAPPPLVEGLDHTPVAVRDLDQAAGDFARLGFAIKPGRPHDDGIRNRHVKFPNGGEIELITAVDPTDALAQEYADWLKDGEGPAFWALYSPDLAALTAFLARRDLAPDNQGDIVVFGQAAMPHRLFFGDRLRSPTDGPAYWANPNTAYRLAGVWLAGSAPELGLLPALGARRRVRAACAPFDRHAVVWTLPGEGDQVMAAGEVRRPQPRSIIGVTVLVRNLATARRILDANQVRHTSAGACGRPSLWVAPAEAHGLWLELYEPEDGSPHRLSAASDRSRRHERQ